VAGNVSGGQADVCPNAAWCVSGGGWLAWLGGFVGPSGAEEISASYASWVGVDPGTALWLDAQRAGQAVWVFFL
jgi:hypothetical protein